jgi:prefoldin alpha subunit
MNEMATAPQNQQPAGDDTLRKMAYQLQFYEAQAKELSRNVEMLQAALEEAMSSQTAIAALAKADGATIFPLGSRVFIFAKPEKKGKLLVEAGAGVMVEKTYEEAGADLDQSVAKIREGLAKAQEQLAEISRKATQLNAQAEGLARSQGNR